MMPDIRPSSDIRNHYAEVSRSCREERRPTILTVNGRGDTVVMGIEDYEEQQARLELLETLVASEQDVLEGRVAPLANTLQSLRDELARGIA
ncbi:MAG: type II toxin-antitoxin system Phd/YefM family antitoxin [Coriobacteriales bacterium]|nr:type II toxin-antitoxin system Phd/YefM family antitoxin [Coriobacteriales bacterium]